MVSGGQDSLTLLHMLSARVLGDVGPDAVSALHVNHHLRGEDSMADQTLVEARCAELGVPLAVVHEPVDKKNGNVQEVGAGCASARGGGGGFGGGGGAHRAGSHSG